jgi:hypothetical protein
MRLLRDDLQPTAWALFHFLDWRVPAFVGEPTVAQVLEQLYPEWEGGRMERESEVESRWVGVVGPTVALWNWLDNQEGCGFEWEEQEDCGSGWTNRGKLTGGKLTQQQD